MRACVRACVRACEHEKDSFFHSFRKGCCAMLYEYKMLAGISSAMMFKSESAGFV